MPKTASTAINLLAKALRRRELETQKAVWKTFGVNYEAEKKKQQEIWRMLKEKQKIKMHRGRGGTPPRGRYPAFLRRLLSVDTQATRNKAVKKIDGLIQKALDNAKNPEIEEIERIQWVRVIGYLYQVQRSIMKDVDASYVQQELEKLKKIVKHELEKRSRKAKA